VKSEKGVSQVEEKPKGKNFEKDEDEEDAAEAELMKIDPDSVDEKTSALHCLGYLVRFCPRLMIPYMDVVT